MKNPAVESITQFARYKIIDTLRPDHDAVTYLAEYIDYPGQHLVLKQHRLRRLEFDPDRLEHSLCNLRFLSHPSLVPLRSAYLAKDGTLTVTREYISDRLPESIGDEHIRCILEAVFVLHNNFQTHGRIKLSNIFVVGQKAKLADAMLGAVSSYLSAEDIAFASPECLAGGQPTQNSDLYSIGVLLYWAHAHHYPFCDTNLDNLKKKYLCLQPLSLAELKSTPITLSQIVEKLLHKNFHVRKSGFEEALRYFNVCVQPPSTIPLVGRGPVLRFLMSKVQTAQSNRSLSIVLVRGKRGTGKSRVLEEFEFRSSLRGEVMFLVSNANRREPFCPFAQLIESITRSGAFETIQAAESKNVLEASRLLFGGSRQLCPRSVDKAGNQLVEWIQKIAARKTLCVAIDDLNSADEMTLTIITLLCLKAAELNMVLFLSVDPLTAGVVGLLQRRLGCEFESISLNTLSRSEAATFINRLAPGASLSNTLTKCGYNPKRLSRALRAVPYQESCRRNNDTMSEPSWSSEHHTQLVSKNVDVICGSSYSITKVGKPGDAASQLPNAVYINRSLFKRFGSMSVDESSGSADRYIGLGTGLCIPAERRDVIVTSAVTQELRLAEDAFRKKMWRQAEGRYSRLARTEMAYGRNVSAVAHFRQALYCQLKLRSQPSALDMAALAQCLARIGHREEAAAIFNHFLADLNGSRRPKLHTALLVSTTCLHRGSMPGMISLRAVIQNASSTDTGTASLYARLCTTLTAAGDLAAANDALNRAKALANHYPSSMVQQHIRVATGFVSMNSGRFGEALRVFRSISLNSADRMAAVLTNAAICLEHTGRLRAAQATQLRAYRLAQESGHYVGQLICLSNLGTFNVKLGQLARARNYFESARALQASRSAESKGDAFRGVEAEEALLNIVEGKYSEADRRISAALNSSTLLANEKLELEILTWELRWIRGERRLPRTELKRITADVHKSGSVLHLAQWALVCSRFDPNWTTAAALLARTLDQARLAALDYETCRLGLEYVRRSIAGGSCPKRILREATSLSLKYGYEGLRAEALMLGALREKSIDRRKSQLLQSFELAQKVGLGELVGEIAYHIGLLSWNVNRSIAKEWLLHGLCSIRKITLNLSTKTRDIYERTGWRLDLTNRLKVIAKESPVNLWLQATKNLHDRRGFYLRAMYQASVGTTPAESFDEYFNYLKDVFKPPCAHILVVVLKPDREFAWYTTASRLSGNITRQIRQLTGTSFNDCTILHDQRQAPAVWLPFSNNRCSGGVYVYPRSSGSFREEDVEFSWVIAGIVRNAADLILCRSIVSQQDSDVHFSGLIGNSECLNRLRQHITLAARHSTTVLIEGETGVGKELVARALHSLSTRRRGKFVTIDCGAIPEGLLEIELFGCRSGSFTGATFDRMGLIELSGGGTLFLDEVGNLPIVAQAKLLRVLETRVVRRVGEVVDRAVDLRLVAASNVSLRQLVESGRFRADLLFRLNTVRIEVPPLRHRKEDIVELAQHFLACLNSANSATKVFAPSAFEALKGYRFPGNVRELRNVVERSFVHAQGNVIKEIATDNGDVERNVNDWLTQLSEGTKDFWKDICAGFKQRDISKEELRHLIDVGLQSTSGSYKDLLHLFRLKSTEYRRLMDFLRRHGCLLDFRPYRRNAQARA